MKLILRVQNPISLLGRYVTRIIRLFILEILASRIYIVDVLIISLNVCLEDKYDVNLRNLNNFRFLVLYMRRT